MGRKMKYKPPEIIYLQWIGEDGVKIDINEQPLVVSWCEDQINNNDIKYIRHNKYAQLRKENERLKDKFDRLNARMQLLPYYLKMKDELVSKNQSKTTEKIFDKNGKLVGEYDYIEYLKFQVKFLSSEISGTFYIENEDGNKDMIDEYGCTKHRNSFSVVGELLRKVVRLQMNKRTLTNKGR